MGYIPWGCKKSDRTERLHFLFFLQVDTSEVFFCFFFLFVCFAFVFICEKKLGLGTVVTY